ncbi:amidase [Pseudomonas auratipiscis]|uniref:Amidase n=1 Tax=Pseudomonas auratipiscis TaxID=3115853 RepID=A0AB35WRX6_9PSED|nr:MULTISPECIES: amidase [unclassified Pseudomonas]MEE1865880.1 amidase [Pseudomonas sp. 120P]MEE1956951.1 amidase [Pseudomonas sp. 119P]
MRSVCDLSAIEMINAFRSKELSPVEVTREVIERAHNIQPLLNAFCLIDEAGALQAARQSEKAWYSGNNIRALEGVPVSIKDVTTVRGWHLGRGSLTSEGNPPAASDSPSVERLRNAGAVLFASTTSCEGGWKAVTDSPRTGITRNPYDLEKTPGGSSGGAAVAVACGAGPIALGSDGGGSIRIPASFTGIFGFKPQYGRVPQYPLGAHYTNMSHQGPMTRCVDDAALALQVMSGIHPMDPDTLPAFLKDDFVGLEGATLQGMRIAITLDYGFMTVAPEIASAYESLPRLLQELGAEVVHLEPVDDWRQTYRTLWQAGAAQAIRRLPEVLRQKVDPGFLAVAAKGEAIAIEEYLEANMARISYRHMCSRLFGEVDAVISPTVAVLPFKTGVDTPSLAFSDWLDWAGISLLANLTGQPAASVPFGYSNRGLPIGLQILGAAYEDVKVLKISKALETANPISRSPNELMEQLSR